MQALHAWSHSVKRYTVILAFWWNAYGTGRPFTFLKQSGAMSLLITNSRNFNNPFYKCSKENSWALLIFFRGIYCPSDSITCSTSSAKTVPFQINRHQICLTVWEVIVFSLRDAHLLKLGACVRYIECGVEWEFNAGSTVLHEVSEQMLQLFNIDNR